MERQDRQTATAQVWAISETVDGEPMLWRALRHTVGEAMQAIEDERQDRTGADTEPLAWTADGDGWTATEGEDDATREWSVLPFTVDMRKR